MKQQLLFFILALLSFSACKEKLDERIVSVHPNNHPALIEYYRLGDTTGYPVKIIRFYINGEKSESYQMQEGLRHGPAMTWHVNGKKKSKANYFENMFDGEYIEWFDNGIKNYEGFYNKGSVTGTWRFYNRDGSLQSETTY